jgi:hypothetical protein
MTSPSQRTIHGSCCAWGPRRRTAECHVRQTARQRARSAGLGSPATTRSRTSSGRSSQAVSSKFTSDLSSRVVFIFVCKSASPVSPQSQESRLSPTPGTGGGDDAHPPSTHPPGPGALDLRRRLSRPAPARATSAYDSSTLPARPTSASSSPVRPWRTRTPTGGRAMEAAFDLAAVQ